MLEQQFRHLANHILSRSVKGYKSSRSQHGKLFERKWVDNRGALFKWCADVLNIHEDILADRMLATFNQIDAKELTTLGYINLPDPII